MSHADDSALDLERATAAQALELIPDGVVLLDGTGRAVYVNEAFSSLLGHRSAEIVGLELDALAGVLWATEGTRELTRACEGALVGEQGELDARLRHVEGYALPVRATVAPFAPGVMVVLRDRLAELRMDIIRLVTSSLDLEQVLQDTTLAVVEHAGLASTAIFLLDEDGSKVRLAACNIPYTPEERAQIVFAMGEPPPGVIAAERRVVYVEDISLALPEVAAAKHWNHSSIGYPLEHRGELLGVIAFDAAVVREFAPRERRTFERIADQVALAIFNAHLVSRLQRMSVTDGLTGLFNHRYFQETLAREVARASRGPTDAGLDSLCLLMIDVDHFKQLNDREGHPVGDRVLKEIVELIRASLRTSDLACRYGGEEFCVILPRCALEEAQRVAERIRGRIAAADLPGGAGQPLGRVTVSIGVARWLNGCPAGDLVELADQAMYQAKALGRNGVQVAMCEPT